MRVDALHDQPVHVGVESGNGHHHAQLAHVGPHRVRNPKLLWNPETLRGFVQRASARDRVPGRIVGTKGHGRFCV
jgi:hypothetical protein